jgi:hypothetical protein
MSSLFRCACVVVLLAGSAGTVCAAPATPEGAARITSGLQTYLGSKEGVVTVVPNGAVYDVTVDFAPLASQLDLPDAALTISPQHLQITDQGEGLWGVKQDEPFRYEINSPGVKVAFSARSNKGEGTFDEKVGWLSQWSSDMVDLRTVQKYDEPSTPAQTDTDYSFATFHTEMTGAASVGGGVDLAMETRATDVKESTIVTDVRSGTAVPLTFSAEAIGGKFNVKGLRTAPLLQIAAWLVAHPSEIEIVVNQEEVRPIVRAALPVFDSIDVNATYQGNSIDAPIGTFLASNIRSKFNVNGLVADGRVRESLSFDGIGVPPGLVPAWASQLIPTSANFDVTGSGFNLADPAALIVGAVNLKSEPILPAGMQTSLLSALLPDGTFDLTFAPAQVKSPLYELNYEGAMTIDVGPGAIPTGAGKVRLTGMDAILEALGKAPKDQTDVTIKGLMMARGIAKPGAVGELVWNIDAMTPGKVMVNSLDLTKLGARQESAP